MDEPPAVGERIGRVVVVSLGPRPSEVRVRCECGQESVRPWRDVLKSADPMCRQCSLDHGPQKRWGGQPIHWSQRFPCAYGLIDLAREAAEEAAEAKERGD